MKRKMFNVLAELTDGDEINALNVGKKNEMDTSDSQAFYFLTIMLVMIVTFSLFKKEILQLLF